MVHEKSNCCALKIRQEVKAWHSNPDGTPRFFLRRLKSVLTEQLPPKHTKELFLTTCPAEMLVYEENEKKLIKVFAQLSHTFPYLVSISLFSILFPYLDRFLNSSLRWG